MKRQTNAQQMKNRLLEAPILHAWVFPGEPVQQDKKKRRRKKDEQTGIRELQQEEKERAATKQPEVKDKEKTSLGQFST
jgi:hypothetical protein